MNKTFDFHICMFSYFPYFLKGKLSCRHHAAGSRLFKKSGARKSGDCHLSAGMNLHVREKFSHIFKNTCVLYDYSVKSFFIQRLQIIIKFTCLFVFEKRIYRKIESLPEQMGFFYRLYELVLCKVYGISSGSEF